MKKQNTTSSSVRPRYTWADLQDVLGGAVAQVCAHVGAYNWCQPYKLEEQTESRGSGFFINADGYLVTNAHVVNEAKMIWLHMPALGKQVIHAHVVGFCPERDLALLRVNTDDLALVKKKLGTLPFLTFGDSDVVRRTDDILTLGYPLGQFRLKSSTGVVSGREAGLGQALIQITAPINPGSSGGPLLNSRGQVIGVTIAGVFDAQNVGYAIPVNELKLILDDLYTQRLVRKPSLGAYFIYANDDKARALGNPEPAGLYISRVFPDSPLEKAGVVAGDMLYELNGHPIDVFGDTPALWGTDKAHFRDLIARVRVGQGVQLVIYRSGKRHDIHFTMSPMPLYPVRVRYPDYEEVDYEVVGGLVVMPLSDNHIKQLFSEAPDLIPYKKSTNKTEPVLVITHILPGSQAQQLRMLAPGDILQEVNGKKVGTLQAFRRMTKKSATTGFWTIQTKRDIVATFAFEKLVDDEKRLRNDFGYPESKLLRYLVKQRTKMLKYGKKTT